MVGTNEREGPGLPESLIGVALSKIMIAHHGINQLFAFVFAYKYLYWLIFVFAYICIFLNLYYIHFPNPISVISHHRTNMNRDIYIALFVESFM